MLCADVTLRSAAPVPLPGSARDLAASLWIHLPCAFPKLHTEMASFQGLDNLSDFVGFSWPVAAQRPPSLSHCLSTARKQRAMDTLFNPFLLSAV